MHNIFSDYASIHCQTDANWKIEFAGKTIKIIQITYKNGRHKEQIVAFNIGQKNSNLFLSIFLLNFFHDFFLFRKRGLRFLRE